MDKYGLEEAKETMKLNTFIVVGKIIIILGSVAVSGWTFVNGQNFWISFYIAFFGCVAGGVIPMFRYKSD